MDTGANSEIYISDFDAHNAQAVTHDNTIVAAPTWCPPARALLHQLPPGDPDIFHHDLGTGARAVFARYGCIEQLRRAVSPTVQVAFVSGKSGNDVWVCNADGTD